MKCGINFTYRRGVFEPKTVFILSNYHHWKYGRFSAARYVNCRWTEWPMDCKFGPSDWLRQWVARLTLWGSANVFKYPPRQWSEKAIGFFISLTHTSQSWGNISSTWRLCIQLHNVSIWSTQCRFICLCPSKEESWQTARRLIPQQWYPDWPTWPHRTWSEWTVCFSSRIYRNTLSTFWLGAKMTDWPTDWQTCLHRTVYHS